MLPGVEICHVASVILHTADVPQTNEHIPGFNNLTQRDSGVQFRKKWHTQLENCLLHRLARRKQSTNTLPSLPRGRSSNKTHKHTQGLLLVGASIWSCLTQRKPAGDLHSHPYWDQLLRLCVGLYSFRELQKALAIMTVTFFTALPFSSAFGVCSKGPAVSWSN